MASPNNGSGGAYYPPNVVPIPSMTTPLNATTMTTTAVPHLSTSSNSVMNPNPHNTTTIVCPTCRSSNTVEHQRLQLLQEHVHLEELLLQEEKKNFKRRLKAAKAATKKTQLLVLKQGEALQTEVAKEKERLVQEFEQEKERFVNQVKELEQKLQHAQEQAEKAATTSVSTPLTETAASSTSSAPLNHDHTAILQLQLEQAQSEVESYQAQLLELERELDQLRAGDGPSAVDDDTYEYSSNSNPCLSCQNLQTKLAQALQKHNTTKRQCHETEMLLQTQQSQLEQLHQRQQELQAENQQLKTTTSTNNNNSWVSQVMAETKRHVGEDADSTGDDHTHATSSNETEADTIISMPVVVDSSATNSSGESQPTHEKRTSLMQTPFDKTTTTPLCLPPRPPVRVASTLTTTQHDAPVDATRLVFEQEYYAAHLVGMYTGYMKEVVASEETITDTNTGIKDDHDSTTNTSPSAARHTHLVPHGLGTLRLDDGAIMDGTWHDGHLHGQGVLATIDGDVYHGEWLNGKKHGIGTLVYSDGRVYRGMFHNNVRHGAGYITWPYGAYYQGQFLLDKRSGQGDYHYADGRYYTGMYQEDRPHGYGVLMAKDGSVIYDGRWELGEFLGDK